MSREFTDALSADGISHSYGARKALDVGPSSQTERRRQRQRSASLQETLCRREVAVEDR